MIPEIIQPSIVRVNRTELREHQSSTLKKVRGTTVLAISGANGAEEERYVVTKSYFDDLVKSVGSLTETLEIMADQKLFQQIMMVADTLDEDLRLGKLHSFEEAFGE